MLWQTTKTKNDARDRNQVAGGESYEVDYIARKHGVTREQVEEAIKAVGNQRDKIEAHLASGKK
ncbi:DUF3606 domain-containing protein [Niabella yanshanensis]|uniref:DUF3606 domain-containing protein n=1 Tax=Niabella yanshanensis TaxID=577386 RepID=A0ABZ0WDN2_9BACT|nr:DUF3606 domain-containing protein [Niabella yanshanensis]WQD40798.1 DUF3606 domain-containing protein [Niabella yanshanensis]